MEENFHNKENISGVEYLKSLGIKEVSNKTFIHEEELERFLNANFDGINKTKAMGFIQILEREFHVDLSDLKSAYLNYLNEHKNELEAPRQPLIMEEVKSEERKRVFFTIIFLAALVGSIVYIIKKYDLLNFTSPNDIKTAPVIDQKEVDSAKINLEKLTTPKKESSNTQKISQTQTKTSSTTQENDLNFQLNEQANNNQNQETTNTNNDNFSLNEVLTPQNENTQNNNEEESQNTNDNQKLDLSKLNEDIYKNTNEQNSNIDQTNNDENKDQQEQKAVQNELYIIPKSKAWIGTIDLDTLKKKDFLASKGKKINIDTSKNQLIMIGHRFIKIYFNGEPVKFKKKSPLRFKYVDGQLTQITRREFNKLAKGKQW